jgi:type I restriction enzyme S subunit
MNKTLEKMAQLIFKHWFVDFEFPNEEGKPYKSSGGKMIESELGMIPEGWKVEKLKECIEFIKGKKPKTISEKHFNNSKPYLTIDVLNRNSVKYATDSNCILVNRSDILMVMDGASSGTLYYGMNGIVGSTLSKISINNKNLNIDIVYYFLKANEHNIKMHLTGSAIPHTDKKFVKKLVMAVPKDKTRLQHILKILADIRSNITVNNQQNARLKNIRNTLLPKLMSGEIRVPLNN